MDRSAMQKPPPVALVHPPIQPLSPALSSHTSLESWKYRASSFRDHVVRRRYWLLTFFAIIVLLIMAISIVFVAHAYFHQFGGQGFLKARDEHFLDTRDLPYVYLPLRKVEVQNTQLHEDDSLLTYLPWNIRSLGPGSIIPFYTCGDQANSCEAFDQPDICCPVGLNCYKSDFTPSGIFCCNSSVSSKWGCEASADNPPQCINSLVECSEALGGGCCPTLHECTPNGCVHVNSASYITLAPGSTLSAFNSTDSSAAASATLNSVSYSGTPITVTHTITMAPAATVTLAKSGEVVAAGSGAEKSLVTRMYLPYSFASAILGVAVFMGML